MATHPGHTHPLLDIIAPLHLSGYIHSLLVISGGHHWRPVQTCSLEDLPLFSPPMYWYWHLVVTNETHTVDKCVVRILLECSFVAIVIPSHTKYKAEVKTKKIKEMWKLSKKTVTFASTYALCEWDYSSVAWKKKTGMLSSRMRTVRFSGHLMGVSAGGGVWSGGVYPGELFAWGCLLRGVYT